MEKNYPLIHQFSILIGSSATGSFDSDTDEMKMNKNFKLGNFQMNQVLGGGPKAMIYAIVNL